MHHSAKTDIRSTDKQLDVGVITARQALDRGVAGVMIRDSGILMGYQGSQGYGLSISIETQGLLSGR